LKRLKKRLISRKNPGNPTRIILDCFTRVWHFTQDFNSLGQD
jgi:hypothetical protein